MNDSGRWGREPSAACSFFYFRLDTIRLSIHIDFLAKINIVSAGPCNRVQGVRHDFLLEAVGETAKKRIVSTVSTKKYRRGWDRG